MMLRWMVHLNNRLTRWRRVRVSPREVLLLLPHCLHKDSCPQNVVHSLDECRRCGQCSLASLSQLRDDLGVVACVAGGGRQALMHTKRPDIKAVVAVACEKELVHGILAAFPKPVMAVPILTPEGFCRNTMAEPQRVIAAIEEFVGRNTDAC